MKHTTQLFDIVLLQVNNCLPHPVPTHPTWCITSVASWHSSQAVISFSALINTRPTLALTVRMLLPACGNGSLCENFAVKRELQWLVKVPEAVNFFYWIGKQNFTQFLSPKHRERSSAWVLVTVGVSQQKLSIYCYC